MPDALPIDLAPFGVLNRARLRHLSLTDHQIRRLLSKGHITRLRPGWFAGHNAHPWVTRAVSAGGALSGLHRLKLLDEQLWLPERAPAHVHARRTLPDAADCIVHQRPRLSDHDIQFGVVPVPVALRHGLREQPLDHAVAIADSLLRVSQMRHPADVYAPDVLVELSRTPFGREVLALVDTAAESGLESIVRVRLILAGHVVEIQVRLSNGWRIDLLVDGVLAIEINGSTHMTREQFQRDHEKDRMCAAAGYRTARYTYSQIMYDWPNVLADIRRRLAQ